MKLFFWHILRVQIFVMTFKEFHLRRCIRMTSFQLLLLDSKWCCKYAWKWARNLFLFFEKENIIQIFHWDLKQDMNFNRMTAFGYKLAQWVCFAFIQFEGWHSILVLVTFHLGVTEIWKKLVKIIVCRPSKSMCQLCFFLSNEWCLYGHKLSIWFVTFQLIHIN
jgi:hypothetical protein